MSEPRGTGPDPKLDEAVRRVAAGAQQSAHEESRRPPVASRLLVWTLTIVAVAACAWVWQRQLRLPPSEARPDDAAVERGVRAALWLQAGAVAEYRSRQGHWPERLEEAGRLSPDMSLRLEGDSIFVLTAPGPAGPITLRSTQGRAEFLGGAQTLLPGDHP